MHPLPLAHAVCHRNAAHRLAAPPALLLVLLALLAGCARTPKLPAPGRARLEVVAESPRQWTGVAAAADGRLFVNYPRWSKDVPVSVAVLEPRADGSYGSPIPYPNRHLNGWHPGLPPRDHFVCVQAVVVDARQRLWVLDPANPQFKGVVPGGPKLVQIDLHTSAVLNVIHFPASITPPTSYLNDVRIDTRTETAYITDSGAGALVVVDLKSGEARRLLAGERCVTAEDVDLVFDGKPWRRQNDERPRVHADGIALTADGRWLYWQALTGRTLYRIETRHLRDATLSDVALATYVETVGAVSAADGIEFGPDGALYQTALEHNAIVRRGRSGDADELLADRRLAWPDSLAFGPQGELYVTSSQIHLPPNSRGPYRLFRLTRD